MSPCIESIKVLDGRFFNLAGHSARMNRTRRNYYGLPDSVDLAEVLRVPAENMTGLYKCRVIYKEDVLDIRWEVYRYKPYRSLKIAADDEIDYTYKLADREMLDRLFSLRGECDNILIVKNGLLTDSHSANILLEDPDGLWTPAKPLLRGTKRQLLLDRGEIAERDIRPGNLPDYFRVHIINAFLDPGECTVPVSHIS
jgi:4-amino-4-deoxychorismate lyase